MSNKADRLHIINARENNLKELSLDLKHDALTVVTGLSGSGKSSLAFDTVYAEGQRRYIETFSPYTRQFFDKVKKPDVDALSNVRPAVAIQQRTRITSARSTVGSLTNINDYLKILYQNLATPICPICQKPLKAWSPASLAKHIKELETPYETLLIGASITINKKHTDLEIERLKTLGFARIWDLKNAEFINLDDVTPKNIPLNDGKIIVIVDRYKAQSFNEKRARTSLEQCFVLSEGEATLIFSNNGSHELKHFYSHFVCEEHGIKVKRAKPYLFSFNHPLGACPLCKGFGFTLQISKDKCIPDPTRSIKDHAVQCWSGNAAKIEHRDLLAFCKANDIDTDIPWKEISTANYGEVWAVCTC